MPNVSVIIPTYNRCVYVQEAIDSILEQTYTDYEIIVIDDGSTDGTQEALRERYGDSIRYVWQENQGEAAARNHGIAISRGTYIALLDDDDLALPERLEMQVAAIVGGSEVGLVAGGAQLIDGHGTATGEWRPWEGGGDWSLANCLGNCPLAPSLVLIRRSELDRLDHWFDPLLVRAGDTDFFLRLLMAGCRFAWVERLVSAYRQHIGSMQHDAGKYAEAYRLLYRKLFLRGDMPSELQPLKPRFLAGAELSSGARYYAAGECEPAKQHLEQAAALMPEWAHDGVLLERVLRYGENPLVGVDADEHRHLVLANLPLVLDTVAIRRRGLARVAMAEVFRAAEADDWETVRSQLWGGVTKDPNWLANRGVWSILLRSLWCGLGSALQSQSGAGDT